MKRLKRIKIQYTFYKSIKFTVHRSLSPGTLHPRLTNATARQQFRVENHGRCLFPLFPGEILRGRENVCERSQARSAYKRGGGACLPRKTFEVDVSTIREAREKQKRNEGKREKTRTRNRRT